MDAVLKEKSYPANYPADALAIIAAMSFSKGKSVSVLGSMGMRSQQYAGDYDLFEKVKTKGAEQAALRNLATGFQQIVKNLIGMPNVYVGDIKAGAIPEWQIINSNAGVVGDKIENYNSEQSRKRIDELERSKVITRGEAKFAHSLIKDVMTPEDFIEAKKEIKFHIVRWSPLEVIHGVKILRDNRRYSLEEAFNTHSMTKLDAVGLVQNSRFTDFSIIYEFFNNGKALNSFPLNVAQSLNEDIIYYKAHGNNFKMLKRMFALAKLKNDTATVDRILPILNSDLGRLYLIMSDIGTLIELFQNKRNVPMPMVRFELDQMKGRMSNIYNLPDFLSEEHDLIGDINAILKMTQKPQIISRLNQIMKKIEKILNGNTKLKGGATERERGAAARIREKFYSGTSASLYNNNLYQDLSLIAHDPSNDPVATGASPVNAGKPYLKTLAAGLLTGVLPRGYPLERSGFYDPVTRQRMPPPPDTVGVASEPPADNTWFDPSGRYNETDDVWRAFVLGNPASYKREFQYPQANGDDMAALTNSGMRPVLYSTQTFASTNPPVYGRFTGTPSPVWSPPTSISTGIESGDIEREARATAAAERDRTANLADAEMRARTLAMSKELEAQFPPVDEEERGAYQLYLEQQLRAAKAKSAAAIRSGDTDLFNTPKVNEGIEGLVTAAINQARTELAEEPETIARATAAQSEEAARAAAAEAAKSEKKAAKKRGIMSPEEMERISRLEAEAKAAEVEAEATGVLPLEEEIAKDNMSQFPKEEHKKIKIIIDNQLKYAALIRSIPALKATQAKLEAELKTFPKKPNQKQKARQSEVSDELAIVEQSLADAEAAQPKYAKGDEVLKALVKAHPKPKIFTANLADPLDEILKDAPEFNSNEGVAELLPKMGIEYPEPSIAQVKRLSRDIEFNWQNTQEQVEVIRGLFTVAQKLNTQFRNGANVLMGYNDEDNAGTISRAEFTKKSTDLTMALYNQVVSTTLQFLFVNPYRIMLWREGIDKDAPEGKQVMLKTIFDKLVNGELATNLEKEGLSTIQIKTEKLLRENVEGLVDETGNVFQKYIDFAKDVPNKQLIAISRMSVGVPKLLREGIKWGIKTDRKLRNEVESFRKIMMNEDGNDEGYFAATQTTPVQAYLKAAREVLKNMSPRAQQMAYMAMALSINAKPNEILTLHVPAETYLYGEVEKIFDDTPPSADAPAAAAPTGEGRVRRRRHVPFAKSPLDAYRR